MKKKQKNVKQNTKPKCDIDELHLNFCVKSQSHIEFSFCIDDDEKDISS